MKVWIILERDNHYYYDSGQVKTVFISEDRARLELQRLKQEGRAYFEYVLEEHEVVDYSPF